MPASHDPEPGEDSIDIELSARDLLELSGPSVSASQPSVPSAHDGRTTSPNLPKEATASSPKAISTSARNIPRLAMIAGGVFAAIAVGSVVRYQPATTDASPQPSPIVQASASSSEGDAAGATQGVPVRITNSFDKSEVFEFPPGTSESEARAAVADLLLKRATERMN